MNKLHLNLIFPQWQGGGQDLSTYEGALTIKNNYFDNISFFYVDVNTQNISKTKNNIVGYDDIFKQLTLSKAIIEHEKPETIFTIGGGCDADITSISYLNEKTRNDMAILYFDAHGDMNTPESSESNLFYGMPLRTLLGDGDERIIKLLGTKILPSQLIMLGVRDLDKGERRFVKKQKISIFTVKDIEKNIDMILNEVKLKGFKNIYIHIDLDILDCTEFPGVPVPVTGGLKINIFLKLLKKINKNFRNIGIGLFEYSSSEIQKTKVMDEIINIGINL